MNIFISDLEVGDLVLYYHQRSHVPSVGMVIRKEKERTIIKWQPSGFEHVYGSGFYLESNGIDKKYELYKR